MSTRVHLYSTLQNYTGGETIVEVNGNTVRECLNDLIIQYPNLKPVLFEDQDHLRSIVFVSVNLNSPAPEKLDKPVSPGDELYIVLVIVGGNLSRHSSFRAGI